MNTAVFTAYGLDEYTEYTATVSGIRDRAGNMMNNDSSHSFTTGRNTPITGISITDGSGHSSSTTYCGFESYEITLTPTANGITIPATWSTDDPNNIVTLTEQRL